MSMLRNAAELSRLRTGRAVATADRLEDDNNHVVHEQLARLRFVLERVNFTGRSVLDFGSGAGYVLDYLRQTAAPGPLAGIDCDPEIVHFARARYTDTEFTVGDAAAPGLDLGRRFDVVLSFEVLEHVCDQAAYLENAVRHLRPGGTLVVSTPNRDVFSLGESVSLHNSTHRRELTLLEFDRILSPLLSSTTLYGQRFRIKRLQRRYLAGTRHLLWRRRARARFESIFPRSNPVMRAYFRLEVYHDRLRTRTSPVRGARWYDFEFSNRDLQHAIWFVALGGRS